MRILHAADSAKTATLGLERETATLAVAQQSGGSDVMIVTDRPGVFTESCREHGVSVAVCSRLKYPFGRLVISPEQAVELEEGVQGFLECVQGFNPDIIHCHSPNAALVAITAGNRVGIPCAFTGDDPRVALGGWQRGLRFAVLSLTLPSFEGLLKSEMPDENLFYVPNGTRSMPPEPADENVGSPPTLIFAGQLDSRKGVDILILAMVELRRRLGQSCPFLNIYGDGVRRKHLTEMASVLQLDDIVQFHGFKHGILEECPSSNILVLPSRFEASPLVVLEALSRGMPIVATDVGEVARMLPDSRYGRVAPKDSVIPLADAIEALLTDIADGRFDRDLLIERHRSLYSIEKFAERTEAAYSQILVNSSATAR